METFLANFEIPAKLFFTKEESEKWDQKELFDSIGSLRGNFKKLNEQCELGFMAGNYFSLVDVNMYPYVAIICRFGFDISKYLNLNKYMNQMYERKSIQASYPPHWKNSPNQTKLGDFIEKSEKLRKN